MSNGVIGWTTKKEGNGFKAIVRRVAYQQPTEILFTGTRPTRAQAVGLAKKAVRYYKAQAAKAAA